jgi:cobalamin-dependent methionine synthase I
MQSRVLYVLGASWIRGRFETLESHSLGKSRTLLPTQHYKGTQTPPGYPGLPPDLRRADTWRAMSQENVEIVLSYERLTTP